MKYIPLGSREVPAIGLGTYKLTGPPAVDIILRAIETGYRHLDTAQLYENESEVGLAMKNSGLTREEFFLTTKVWPSNLREDKFIPSVEQSLEKLQTSYVDLLLIHWPHQTLTLDVYVETLMKCKNLGLAKEIGVSNFNIAQLKTALGAGAEIVTNQVEFHPWVNQTKLYNWMREHQIPLTAYCPLGQGRFMTDKKLEVLATKYSRSPAQIILRWMMEKDGILAIPKSSHPERLAENLQIFDFHLTEEEMQMIDAWKLENQRVVGMQAGAKWDS
jgi:2,5-diketo-D-gluconate reductase B